MAPVADVSEFGSGTTKTAAAPAPSEVEDDGMPHEKAKKSSPTATWPPQYVAFAGLRRATASSA
jgi:hypothetical protein